MRAWFVVMLSCATSACSNPAPAPVGTTDMGPWASAYAIATTLQANTPQATSLVFAVPSLEAGVAVDYGQAVSVADTVTLFGVPNGGAVYATTAMATNVTRYDVDAQGVVTPGAVLGFAQFGLGATYSTRSIVFASPSKAYLLDDTTLQAITFDPQAMTTGKAVDLGALKRDNYHTNFSYNVPMRGSQIVVAAFYYDASYARTIADTAIALIDTTTDAVKVITDARCGAFSTAAVTPNGDLYFGSDTYSVAIHRIGGDGAAPNGCLLRMEAGQDVLDPDFFENVSDLTGGQIGGAAVPGPGNTLWVRAFDESLLPVDATTSGLAILSAPAWHWWSVDLANPTAPASRSSFPAGAGEVKYFSVEQHAFAGNPSQDYTTTTVLDMTATGAPVAAIEVRGTPSGIVKVR